MLFYIVPESSYPGWRYTIAQREVLSPSIGVWALDIFSGRHEYGTEHRGRLGSRAVRWWPCHQNIPGFIGPLSRTSCRPHLVCTVSTPPQSNTYSNSPSDLARKQILC